MLDCSTCAYRRIEFVHVAEDPVNGPLNIVRLQCTILTGVVGCDCVWCDTVLFRALMACLRVKPIASTALMASSGGVFAEAEEDVFCEDEGSTNGAAKSEIQGNVTVTEYEMNCFRTSILHVRKDPLACCIQACRTIDQLELSSAIVSTTHAHILLGLL